MNRSQIAGLTCVIVLTSGFPAFMASFLMAIFVFGGLAFAGAMLMDRYADLPGDDRRRA